MKKKAAKPVKPVEDTVWFRDGRIEGVGVFRGPGNAPGSSMIDVRGYIYINASDKLSEFDITNMTEQFPDNCIKRVHNAYVYGWIQMQKNLIQFRKDQKDKQKE